MTRSEYMSQPYDPATSRQRHHEYYSQFVTEDDIELVRATFGARIATSCDELFNDIPLLEWDRLHLSFVSRRLLFIANGNRDATLADMVCVLKAAARIIKRENTNAD